MRSPAALTTGLVLISFLGIGLPAGGEEPSVRALLDDASVELSFRYRYEHVDSDQMARNADASTLRSRLSMRSGSWRGLEGLLELEDVREVIVDDFNAGAGSTPDRTRFPVVADPEGAEINQAWLGWQSESGTRLRLGRQRINLDNQRFVGGVGWRQNEQTFDAISLHHAGDRLRLFYALVDNVNRIFGDDVAAGDHRQDPSHLLNVGVTLSEADRGTVYHYVLDNEDAPGFSTRTTGAHFTGERSRGGLSLGYQAEFARQTDHGNNPVAYDADYWHLVGSLKAGTLQARIGWEVLEGDAGSPGSAFRTPLATLHAFNGWADQFLATPTDGLDDRYVALKVSPRVWVAELRLHRFTAEDGSGDHGRELDLHLGRTFGEHIRGDIFAAVFEAEDGFHDETRFWLMLSARL